MINWILKLFLGSKNQRELRRMQPAIRRINELEQQYASLSDREREVMGLIVTGLLNKQVGIQLGISEITVKAHRGKAMRKMRADSFADLVQMATRLGVASVKS